MLRPNVKRSRGALRDIQLIRWIGFARYGETDLERLVKLGAVPEEDYRQLRLAYAFLLRLRHELHFREKKSQDVLDRGMQMEIAEAWGYQGTEGVLPVEQFMQDYFEHTRNVRYASTFFVDDATESAADSSLSWSDVFLEKIDERDSHGADAYLGSDGGSGELRIEPAGCASLDEACQSAPSTGFLIVHGRRFEMPCRTVIRRRPIRETIEEFLSLLSSPGRLAPLLRRLHELRIIEQLIPEFKRMRGLLQFNAYHKYTVDAHSIRAVEAATDLENDKHGMGRRYRRLDDKRLLHLALLIHDIGKGYEEDHCIVGARIAKKTAERLMLDPNSAETLEWLVLKHLVVNVIAFRHDLSDPQIVLVLCGRGRVDSSLGVAGGPHLCRSRRRRAGRCHGLEGESD